MCATCVNVKMSNNTSLFQFREVVLTRQLFYFVVVRNLIHAREQNSRPSVNSLSHTQPHLKTKTRIKVKRRSSFIVFLKVHEIKLNFCPYTRKSFTVFKLHFKRQNQSFHARIQELENFWNALFFTEVFNFSARMLLKRVHKRTSFLYFQIENSSSHSTNLFSYVKDPYKNKKYYFFFL